METKGMKREHFTVESITMAQLAPENLRLYIPIELMELIVSELVYEPPKRFQNSVSLNVA